MTDSNADLGAIQTLLNDYFDGLYDGDLDKFSQVFHAQAHLYSTDGQSVTDVPREQYFKVIAGRESPSALGLKRHDKIVSIHVAGPDTAHAVVNCAIPPRFFTDYLTLLRGEEGWQIISKTFHTDVHE